MAESIEQAMRTLKLGGMAKEWRSVAYENNEQYVTDLLQLELKEREANRINRMVKTAGFRVIKTLDDFVWNGAIELPADLTREYMEDLSFLPGKENLIFMFIDLRHSTALAEELGHVKYSNFMKDYYKFLSNCCEENRGQIYQIAGDGAFLTWPISACRNRARPIDCFFDFCECLERISPKFIKKYGAAPKFKAGAHCGTVVTTEVGNFGSEMAYHGDVLNTTSRIQSLCARLGQEFLISEELYNVLPKPFPHGYMSKKEGFFELRGKKHEILIFSLQRPLTSLN